MTPTFPAQVREKPPKNQIMSAALLSLLVYTVGVKARGFNKKETYLPTHVISVGESSLTKMVRDEGARHDFVAHNRGHLTRAYPKGSRVTSSNFAPHHMWAAGVQLVALNWQTFGKQCFRISGCDLIADPLSGSRRWYGAERGYVC